MKEQGIMAIPASQDRCPRPFGVEPLRVSSRAAGHTIAGLRQYCEICDAETVWDDTREFSDHDWCTQCGVSKEMLENRNEPGGCPAHPDATHEEGFGLAGGGYGPYSICNECGAVFDKVDLGEDAA